MASVGPLGGSERPAAGHAPAGGTKVDKGKQQVSWLLEAYFALLQLEVKEGKISPKKAHEIESTLKHLHDQASSVSSEDELRYLFSTLSSQVGIVNKEVKKVREETGGAKGGDLFPSSELVEPGSERSGVMAHLQTFMNFLDRAANQQLLGSSDDAKALIGQVTKVWEDVQKGVVQKPDQAMGMVGKVVEGANALLPPDHQFPPPPLSAYSL